MENQSAHATGSVPTCLKNRIDAKILIEEFRQQFNEVRPHSRVSGN